MAEIDKNADAIINNHMIWSMGAGLIPVPVADFFAVSAIQLDMVRQLCNLYEVSFNETKGKALITSLTTTGLARYGARTALKFIPGVGAIIGGVAMGIFAGASTYALGHVFRKHFETGGTFLDFDTGRLKEMYKDLFEKGKEIAADIQKEAEENEERAKRAKKGSKADDIVNQLKGLAELKEKGAISEEEYEELKKKLMESL